MSGKLKALALGILAILAVGAVAAMNAGAETGGHFTSDVEHTTLLAEETETHQLELGVEGLTGIVCTHATYHGTVVGKTVEQITIVPTYTECVTTGETTHNVVVHMNGCNYLFTIGKTAEAEDHTVHLVCPEGKTVEITHESCVIKFPEQTVTAATYTTKISTSEKHHLTVDIDATKATSHFEAGFCILLGTKHPASLTGSVTIEGFDENNNPVNITATGSED